MKGEIDIQNDKRYRRFLSEGRKKEPEKESERMIDSVTWADMSELLNRCRDLYEKGAKMREQARRCTDYTQGDQWCDYIEDPDSMFKVKIKEENYIKRQGFVPLKYNIMKKSMTTTCGLFANQQLAPTVGVRGSGIENRKIGDMVTCALRAAGQANQERQLLSSEMEEAWQKGMFCMSVRYQWDVESEMQEVYVQHENIYKLIIENNLSDKNFRDMRLIGMIRDMKLEEVVHKFAKSPAEAEMICQEYTKSNMLFAGADYTFAGDRFRGSADNFFVGSDPSLCRVFEIWTKETESALFVHDYATGMDEYRDVSDQYLIEQENARRIMQVVTEGGSPNDAALIVPIGENNGWTTREFWYYRYLTPLGHVLMEGETPYNHKSHPFVFGGFPMVDGRICSPAEGLIDVQRALNRTLSQIDFIRQRGAKNVLMVDTNAIPDNIRWDEFADEYSRNGSVLFLKLKPGAQMPQQLKSATVQDGDVAVVNMYKQFADEISGMSGAIRGEKATADTPASLYAQQAQNSENNIAYFMQWFNGCVDRLHWKMVMLIQQYYEDQRYLPVSGNEFEEEAKIFRQSDARSVKLYLEIINQQSVSFYQAQYENTLSMALQSQAIDFLTYLQNTRAPFAHKLADEIVRRQEQMNG